LLQQGGIEAIGHINQNKARQLYAAIDGSDFYTNPVEKRYRSWMNIPFNLKNTELDVAFLEQAAKKGLASLKGHRSVGGMRASIYNAMPKEGVDTLVAFMSEFAQVNA
jgi:phosphoserine aminotransferase